MSRWLVGSSSSSRSGFEVSARASEARVSSPPEKPCERAVELLAVEAEAAQRDARRCRASGSRRRARAAPAPGVGVERRLGGVALGHPPLELGELGLDLRRSSEPRGDVLAQGPALARRALVVEGDARAALERDRARVEAGLADDRPQQGRLAAAVAPGERHPVAALELERDVAEQRPRADVLGQAGGCDRGQGQTVAACSAASSRTWKLEPQPQAATTFGLFTVNPAPWRPST